MIGIHNGLNAGAVYIKSHDFFGTVCFGDQSRPIRILEGYILFQSAGGFVGLYIDGTALIVILNFGIADPGYQSAGSVVLQLQIGVAGLVLYALQVPLVVVIQGVFLAVAVKSRNHKHQFVKITVILIRSEEHTSELQSHLT